jgi:transposase
VEGDGLIKNENKPVFLIVDGNPVHRSKRIQAFVPSTMGRLKFFLLPPYSLELNPEEQVWSHLKHYRIGKMVIKTKEKLISKVDSALRSIQRTSSLIKSFFRHKECCYSVHRSIPFLVFC